MRCWSGRPNLRIARLDSGVNSIRQAKVLLHGFQRDSCLSTGLEGFPGSFTKEGVLQIVEVFLDQPAQIKGLGSPRLTGEAVEPSLEVATEPNRGGHGTEVLGCIQCSRSRA